MKPVVHGLGLFKALLNHKCLCDEMVVTVGNLIRSLHPNFVEMSKFVQFMELDQEF